MEEDIQYERCLLISKNKANELLSSEVRDKKTPI